MAAREKEVVQKILVGGGVPAEAVLVVHSAMSGLARQGHRAEGLIEAMLEHLSGGTLLMPTMTWRTVTPENPVFDELDTPSHTGILTEIFRTRYATGRSLHPTHSVAGVGARFSHLLGTHHLGNTPVPASSPYALMRNYPSHILLLGVGFEMCTAIHYPEEVIAPEIYLVPIQEAEHYELRRRDGSIIPFTLRRHRRLNRDFQRFGSLLEGKGLLRSGDLGGVPWSIMRADDLLREVFTALIGDPRATLAAPERQREATTVASAQTDDEPTTH